MTYVIEATNFEGELCSLVARQHERRVFLLGVNESSDKTGCISVHEHNEDTTRYKLA